MKLTTTQRKVLRELRMLANTGSSGAVRVGTRMATLRRLISLGLVTTVKVHISSSRSSTGFFLTDAGRKEAGRSIPIFHVESPRVIDQLRGKHGGRWRYDVLDRKWSNGTRTVRAYSVLAPQHDCDDQTTRTEYRFDDGDRELALP